MSEDRNIVPIEDNGDDDTPEEIKDLIEELSEVIEEDGEGKEAKVTRIAVAMAKRAELFAGPLPHPRILAQYKEVMADAPTRIIAMAEQEQQHRHHLERTVVEGSEKRANVGLYLGFFLFLALTGGSVYLLAIGRELGGFVTLGGAIAGAVITLIQTVTSREREAEENKSQRRVTHDEEGHETVREENN